MFAQDPTEFIERMRDATPEERQAIMAERREESFRRAEREWNSLTPEERERRNAEARAARELAEKDLPRLNIDEIQKLSREEQLEYYRKLAEANSQIYHMRRSDANSGERDRGDNYELDRSMMPDRDIDRWQFRSLLKIGGTPEFSLHNPWENRTFWARIGQSRYGMRVVSFDEIENTLRVEHGSESTILPLTGSHAITKVTPPSELARFLQDIEGLRERFDDFHRKWSAAVAQNPELLGVEANYDRIADDIRRNADELKEISQETMTLEREERHRRIRGSIRERSQLFAAAKELTGSFEPGLRDHPSFADTILPEGDALTVFMLFGR